MSIERVYRVKGIIVNNVRIGKYYKSRVLWHSSANTGPESFVTNETLKIQWTLEPVKYNSVRRSLRRTTFCKHNIFNNIKVRRANVT